MRDIVVPSFDLEWIRRCYMSTLPCELVSEYRSLQLCLDILCSDEYLSASFLTEYADFLYSVICEVMAERFSSLCACGFGGDGCLMDCDECSSTGKSGRATNGARRIT